MDRERSFPYDHCSLLKGINILQIYTQDASIIVPAIAYINVDDSRIPSFATWGLIYQDVLQDFFSIDDMIKFWETSNDERGFEIVSLIA